ncbi:MAG TPA: hypothetical protein VK843_14840 [Planctomycetota bacterium]|nr:hypothetical protein [Planctomycetota bacterium]
MTFLPRSVRVLAPGFLIGLLGTLIAPSASAQVLYCNPKVNSKGCTPAIGWAGTSSVSAPFGFVISGSNSINNAKGWLNYSVSGSNNSVFAGGTLCIRRPIFSTPTQDSMGTPGGVDCTGLFLVDMNAFAARGGEPFLRVPGTTVWAQFQGQDIGYIVPNDVYLSDGIEYTVGL